MGCCAARRRARLLRGAPGDPRRSLLTTTRRFFFSLSFLSTDPPSVVPLSPAMHASFLTALALAAVSVKALEVTSPDKQTEWGSSGSHVRDPFPPLPSPARSCQDNAATHSFHFLGTAC